jgi:8-amino-7-oxononanoate synthase
MLGLKQLFVHSKSAIQSAIIPGNENVISIAKTSRKGFDVRYFRQRFPGQERLRFVCTVLILKKCEVLRLLGVFIFSPQI